MAIQIGKYKRPGIFIEEFDKSIIATPQPVDQLTNLVLGVSKKGPVNTPVKVSTLSEFEAIFGEIDRNLERRGSFFHRTVEKMLESSPVYAMNLLLTNDNLDRVEYQSLSTSSDNLNDSKRLGAYRKFHDTTGFWKKDTESFINLTRSNPGYGQRALNITNLSDKPVSVFIYKSRANGFDVTAESWFGAKRPGYISPNDFISDYMVDVVIVEGDWSDYKKLAQDKVWSNYFFFDTKLGSGIRKNLVLDFIQNRSVKLLGYYEGLSLIPYFRDGNNKNLFIETNLNKDTDKTGIFCSYNIDLVETDGLNNIIDLVGHTIAAKNESVINFLSYQSNISEEMEFSVKPLDLPGNVTSNAVVGVTFSNDATIDSNLRTISNRTIGNYSLMPYKFLTEHKPSTHFYGFDGNTIAPLNPFSATFSGVQTSNYINRTSWFAEGNFWGVKYDSFSFDSINLVSDVFTNANTLTFNYKVHENAYFIIDGQYKSVILDKPVTSSYKDLSFTVNVKDYAATTATQSYMATVYFENATSQIKLLTDINPANPNGSLPTNIDSKDIVLNTFRFKIKQDSSTGQNKFLKFNSWNISVDSNGNRVGSKFAPIYSSEYNGLWPVILNDGAYQTDFSNHFLNNVLNNYEPNALFDSSGKPEHIHVDTTFLNDGTNNSNPLLHDPTSFIRTFYKNTKDKRFLNDNSSAEIGATGNIKFTGGKLSSSSMGYENGYVINARMFQYSNTEKFNYTNLTPVFATYSGDFIWDGTNYASRVIPGTCIFKTDAVTGQLYAELTQNTKWNANYSQLSPGDLVSVWGIGNTGITSHRKHNNSGIDFTFNKSNGSMKAIHLIVDKILDDNKIYFLVNSQNNAGTSTLNTMFGANVATNLYTATAITSTDNTKFTVQTGSLNDIVAISGQSKTGLTVRLANGVDTGIRAKVDFLTVGGIVVPKITFPTLTPTIFNVFIDHNTDLIIDKSEFAITSGVITTAATSNLFFRISSDVSKTMKIIPNTNRLFTLEKVNHDIYDYRVSYEGNGKIKYTFLNTDNSPNTRNYRTFRRHKMFNSLVALLNSADKDKRVLVLNGDSSNKKVSMEGMFLSEIVTSVTQNKSFILNTNLPDSEIVKSDWEKVLQGFLCIYTVDDEVILGTNGMDTRMIGLTSSLLAKDTLVGDGIGVVSKYSDLYQQYYNGYINNGDYFQNNRTPSDVWKRDGYTVTFFDGEEDKSITGLNTGKTTLFAGYNYIMFTASFANSNSGPKNDPKFSFGDGITIRTSKLNKKRINILSDNLASSIPGSTIAFTDANGLVLDSGLTNGTQKTYIYKIEQEVVYEKLTGVKEILDHQPASGFNYLNMYVDNKTEANGNVVKDSLSIRYKTDYSLRFAMPPLGTVIDAGGLDPLNKFTVISQNSNYKQTLEIEKLPVGVVDTNLVDPTDGSWLKDNQILVNGTRYSELRVGDFLLGINNRLVRIIDKRVYSKDTTLVLVTCNGAIRRNIFGVDEQTYLYKSVDNYTYAYKALTFRGFKVRPASLPDGTEKTQNDILDIVGKGTPLFRALTNKEAIDYRYLVDSFGLGLHERSKQQLADICGSRKDIFGFLNMPSVKSFKQSISPTFLDENGDLNVDFIAKGSNPDKAAEFTYTFADGDGTTCVGYFTPYIQVDDNGRQLSMPPASHVATTYMKKHTSNLGGITPWTIAAGVTNGRITNIIGLEHNYSNEDIELLNQAQMNPIVFKRNRGNVIETENTAQTLYRSALSYIHVREVLIELERELSRMLLDFQWQYNTAEIRAEIKLRADVICETYVNRNGLYNYFNKMDDENNTSEIIDNQIGVLDTYVEPIKGMGIIVNNVTILRTGAIDAGGFL
jgi:hypothetical protein